MAKRTRKDWTVDPKTGRLRLAAPGGEEVMAFLLGEGPLDGVWFGDRHPTEKGAFWWRKHLRAAMSSHPADVAAGERK